MRRSAGIARRGDVISGVSFYPGARKSAPVVVAQAPVVQRARHGTVRAVDTVRVARVDTVTVTTHVREQVTSATRQTVKGQDVILVLRDANFDVGKSVLRPGRACDARFALA